MRLDKSILIKDTVSLFSNKYQYKIVLVCPAANWFRGNDLDFVEARLKLLKTGQRPLWLKIKSNEDIEYCFDLQKVLVSSSDYNIRVEHPYLNFYSNNSRSIEALAGLDPARVSYVCMPNKTNPSLKEGAVIVKKLDYDYKVFLGKTTQDNSTFVTWARQNKNIRLTKRAEKDLCKTRSYGGSYFYVRTDKAMTMVRMFVGTYVSKVESVIKA